MPKADFHAWEAAVSRLMPEARRRECVCARTHDMITFMHTHIVDADIPG